MVLSDLQTVTSQDTIVLSPLVLAQVVVGSEPTVDSELVKL